MSSPDNSRGTPPKPRPEHRTHSIHDTHIIDLGSTIAGTKLVLRCTNCSPWKTRPVRKCSDPETVVRCAQCGKKHSDEATEVEYNGR